MYKETIEHMFFNCIEVRNFWLEIFDKMNKNVGTNIQISIKGILLGYKLDDKTIENNINVLCLYGKKYIHSMKLQFTIPRCQDFLSFIQRQHSTYAEIKSNKLQDFFHFIGHMVPFNFNLVQSNSYIYGIFIPIQHVSKLFC